MKNVHPELSMMLRHILAKSAIACVSNVMITMEIFV